MNILFITNDLIGGNIALLLKNEGHKVKLSIQSQQQRKNFDNLVTKTTDWRDELKWVGKNGLIVFDDVGFGKIQDKLRQKGYSVYGGSELGDKLEKDRENAHNIFAQYGLKTVTLRDFKTINAAIKFIKKNKGPWVVKQNDHASKSLNYVGEFEDGRDAISVLQNYNQHNREEINKITLQKRINGIEIAVGRYFNGHDWVGPIDINLEHKKMFPGDIGPSTSEMGTVAWYDNDEYNKLFQETLAKLKPYLQKIDFRGDVDINCIVNEEGAWPLEATPRFGSPIIHLRSEIQTSPWGELFKAIADGKDYNVKWKPGYGIVILLAVPPFPHAKHMRHVSSFGTNIYFKNFDELKMRHVHFEEVSLKNTRGKKQYYISDSRGYIAYVTEMGHTMEEARDKAYDLVHSIIIPKMFYRNDIGLSFITTNAAKLRKWGYIK